MPTINNLLRNFVVVHHIRKILFIQRRRGHGEKAGLLHLQNIQQRIITGLPVKLDEAGGTPLIFILAMLVQPGAGAIDRIEMLRAVQALGAVVELQAHTLSVTLE